MPTQRRRRRRRLFPSPSVAATVASAVAAAAAVVGVATLLAATPARAHTWLTVPPSMSTMEGCRIGGSPGHVVSCPGPCPAMDATSARQPPVTTTYNRGALIEVRYTRNNHEGGFARWSLVPADRAMDAAFHARAAFHYSCWDAGATKCARGWQMYRDCKYDHEKLYYRRRVRLPAVYPDGLYVLGFAWWGGLDQGKGFNAALGDYYDCSYVRIKGGPRMQKQHQPTFDGSGEPGGRPGTCRSSVNMLGLCWREPCHQYKGGYLKPAAFNRRRPNAIAAWWMNPPHRLPAGLPALPNPSTASPLRPFAAVTPDVAATLHGITLLELHPLTGAVLARRAHVNWRAPIRVRPGRAVTIVADVGGDVRWVRWFVGGALERRGGSWPYGIGGVGPGGEPLPWRGAVWGRPFVLRVRVTGMRGLTVVRTWWRVRLVRW